MARQQKLIHLHGSTQLTKAKAEAVGMVAGELAAMNGTTETSELYVLTSGGDIATFVTGAKVAGDIATAKTGAETTAKGYADQALADAKAYTDEREVEIKKYADQAEADALAAAKTYADGLNTDMDTRVDALEAKFGTGDGSVSDQIADAIATEAARSNKYTDDAIATEVTRSNGYADQAEADAITAAKTYTNERETAITTAFTTAINNAIAAIDLENKGTGANTGLDVTVKIEDGKTMTVTVDDSNLIIDCGTY